MSMHPFKPSSLSTIIRSNEIFRNTIRASFTTLAVASLVACGGGGGGSDDSGSSAGVSGTSLDTGLAAVEGTEVSYPRILEEFRKRDDGTWRVEFVSRGSITLTNGPIKLTDTIDRSSTTLIAYDFDSSGDLYDTCNLQGFVPVQQPPTPSCPGDLAPKRVYKIGTDGDLIGEVYCDGELYTRDTSTFISSAVEFNYGNLELTFDETQSSAAPDDLAPVSNGVCGAISSKSAKYKGYEAAANAGDRPIDNDKWSVQVVAPYGSDQRAAVIIDFTGVPQTGVYEVTSAAEAFKRDQENGRFAKVSLASPGFRPGATAEDPAVLQSIVSSESTVTITSVTDLSVSGSFDVRTDPDMVPVTGNFTVDLQP